jgi:hypothetical protein
METTTLFIKKPVGVSSYGFFVWWVFFYRDTALINDHFLDHLMFRIHKRDHVDS